LAGVRHGRKFIGPRLGDDEAWDFEIRDRLDVSIHADTVLSTGRRARQILMKGNYSR
jgi:hypothetical protein